MINATSAPEGGEVGYCTADMRRQWEARQSFPSGHSSFAFAGLVFLSLFLLEKLKPAPRRPQTPSPAPGLTVWMQLQQLAALLPVGLAMWIAETRTVDFWHNYDDILAGSVLGATIAICAFGQRAGYSSRLRDATRSSRDDQLIATSETGSFSASVGDMA